METFRVHILGCGSALPTLRHTASSQVVEHGEKMYMVDCGEGTQCQLRKLHLKFNRIGHVFISHMQAEAKPWTAWKVLNGQLLLNQDTFAVAKLGADSLSLENSACIFVFKRQR